MSVIVEFIGGPLDGHQSPVRARHAFLWVDLRKGHIAYAERGKHRALYRKHGVTSGPRGRWVYFFAGNTHAPCSGCGAYHERMDGHVAECSLCGGSLVLP